MRWHRVVPEGCRGVVHTATCSRAFVRRQVYGSVTASCDTKRVRAPKLLCVASAVDLDFRYGCTPAWWQLWKGLHDEGAELIVAPYRGRPIETPWWRSAPNPAYRRRRVLRLGARGRGEAEGRPLPAAGRGLPRRLARRPGHARDDLARRHPALAPLPRASRRAGAARRGRRLHGADGALPRHPRVPSKPLWHSRGLLRRRRADEPPRVRGDGHAASTTTTARIRASTTW